jgi:phosphate transport system permease protein
MMASTGDQFSFPALVPPAGPVDIDELRRSLRRPRSFVNFLFVTVTSLLTIAALFPLFSVIYMLVVRGIGHLSVESITNCSNDVTGAFGNAIAGTILIVTMAAAISVPIGIMSGVYLAEIGPESRLASGVRFAAKTLSGYPSVLAGVVTYGAVVILIGVSGISGAIALSILMLPTIILTSEEAIRMVPARIREAAIGMGATRAQTVIRVMLPTAFTGILTGIMLAVARAAGETAPLLFTCGSNPFWPISSDGISVNERTASLAVFIYNCTKESTLDKQVIGWSAALVLVALVLATNLIGQSLSARSKR